MPQDQIEIIVASSTKGIFQKLMRSIFAINAEFAAVCASQCAQVPLHSTNTGWCHFGRKWHLILHGGNNRKCAADVSGWSPFFGSWPHALGLTKLTQPACANENISLSLKPFLRENVKLYAGGPPQLAMRSNK